MTVKEWLETAPKNILIRMPNWLGDVVMATPILQDVRSHWKQAKITAMGTSNVAELLKHDPNVDEIFSFKKPSGWIHRRQHLDIYESIRKGKYDLGILMTNSFSSAWWFWRGNVTHRIGFSGHWRRFLLSSAIPHPPNEEIQHQVITYKHILVPLGIPISETAPKLYISEEELNHAKELLEMYDVEIGKHLLIGINPGAKYGSAKCWLPERFKEVTERLLKKPNVRIVFFGDAAGASLVNDICQSFSERVINLAGRTSIRQLMAIIQSCSIVLTNDSGPMHIASALNTPLLALFGSTSAIKTGPYQGGKVIHKHVSCSPCYKRECPIDFRCMKQIGVEEVIHELEESLFSHEFSTS